MAHQTFEVEDIHCGSCEQAIRKALGRVDGVVDAAADQTTNRVDVEFDESRVDPTAIVARLTDAGYPVVT